MPSKWKRNIISNEWKRLRSRCTSVEEKKNCRSTFIEKLKKNGHQQIPFLELNENSHSHTHTNNTSIFYLSIPFIDDQTNRMIRKSIRGLGYEVRLSHRNTRLCDIVNNRISRPPTRNNKCNLTGCKINNNNCFKSMIIYELICNKCMKNYIGSTKKFFHTRVKEHFSQRFSNVFKHNASCKGAWTFKVIQTFKSLQSLRWGEEIVIRQLKPTLNTKEDSMSLQSLLV
jgi:hypothetical protein